MKNISIAILICLLNFSIVLAQETKINTIDLSKAQIELPNDYVINIVKDQETDYFLVFTNVPEGIEKEGFNFGSDVANNLIRSTADPVNQDRRLTFNLAELSDEMLVNGRLQISYIGSEQNTPELFKKDNTISLPFNIITKRKKEDVTGNSPTEVLLAAQKYFENNFDRDKFSRKTGLYEDNNVVHIFIDENGNFINHGLPTTAKETHLYKLHLLTSRKNIGKYNFNFTYAGVYQPTFNIDNTIEEIATEQAYSSNEVEIIDIEYPVIGPFTKDLRLELTRYDISQNNEGSKSTKKTLIDSKLDIAKLYHVSISIGILATSLKNPQNISKVPLVNNNVVSGTDSTLIADDPSSRGMLSVMATYYPWGRSFLFPPNLRDPLSCLGIVVGTELNKDLDENFFGGISYDFARGGSFTLGLHYGRRSFISGYDDFDYGKDIHVGELNIKQEWDLGVYFGVIIDARVAGQLLKSLSNN